MWTTARWNFVLRCEPHGFAIRAARVHFSLTKLLQTRYCASKMPLLNCLIKRQMVMSSKRESKMQQGQNEQGQSQQQAGQSSTPAQQTQSQQTQSGKPAPQFKDWAAI